MEDKLIYADEYNEIEAVLRESGSTIEVRSFDGELFLFSLSKDTSIETIKIAIASWITGKKLGERIGRAQTQRQIRMVLGIPEPPMEEKTI